MKTTTFIIMIMFFGVFANAQDCEYAILDTTRKQIETRELLVNDGEHPLIFRLANFSNFKTFKINFFIDHNIGCFDYGDPMTLTLTDGSVLKLENVGHEDCGDKVQGLVQYATAFFITDEISIKILNAGLKTVSLNSGKETFSFIVKAEHADYFKKYLNCISR